MEHQCKKINLILVKSGGAGVVLDGDGGVGVPVVVRLEEDLGFPVPADLHFSQLGVLPLVHRHGPYEREVDANAAMLAGTFETNPDAVSHRDPLRVEGIALEARLEKTHSMKPGLSFQL
jgi:hypothetical protein